MLGTIKTQYPWSQWYNKCHVYLDNRSNRRMVYLSSNNGKKQTTTFARYLYAVHLGEMIPDHLEVDHVNNDCTDDRVENFQLLTHEENLKKYHDYRISTLQEEYKNIVDQINKKHYFYNKLKFIPNTTQVECRCSLCDKTYRRFVTDAVSWLLKNQRSTYCSKECADKARAYSGSKPELVAKIKQLAKEGYHCKKIAKELNVGEEVVKKYAETPLVNGQGIGSYSKSNPAILEELNKLIDEGKYIEEIKKTLGLDYLTIKKYASKPIVSGRYELHPNSVPKETKAKIDVYAKQGLACYQIAKKLNISFDTVKKYATVPMANGLQEAQPLKLKQDVIDRINSFDKNISNNVIAKTLSISFDSVHKYRTGFTGYGSLPSQSLPERNKLSTETINKIIELSHLNYPTKKIARILNISRVAVDRYRTDIPLDNKTLQLLSEIIFLRKKRLSLKKIRDRVFIGKNKMCGYVGQISRPEVKEKLKGYSVNEYSYYNIFKSQTGQTQMSEPNDQDTLTLDLSLSNKYISYHDYQVTALKSFHEPNGDYTICNTIETGDDVVFITISGTI